MTKNNFFPETLKNIHIHFVGIKGTGMSALVEICANRGAIITGSDVETHFYTDEILKKLNITPTLFNAKNITDDIHFVVYSSAYKKSENVELLEATKKNIPCILYSEALGEISLLAKSTGIAGVHGKTTTTAMSGAIIKSLNLPCQVLAGSVVKNFGDNCTLNIGHKYFVAETCEYQRHFMAFHPENIILTSVESDHQDFYPTFSDIQNAFVDYLCLLPKNGNLIYCADDEGAKETAKIALQKRGDINIFPYGFNAEGDFQIISHSVKNAKQHFSLKLDPHFVFELSVPALHNVRNAVAAIALNLILYCDFNHVSSFSDLSSQQKDFFFQKTLDALLGFTGSKRRSEIIGEFYNDNGDIVTVLDDYGHHPTAIKSTLEGFREFYPDRYIIVDFMSHTYSRTAALLEQFSSCFNDCDEIILHKIYSSARENPKDFENIVSGKILYEKTAQNYPEKKVSYFEEVLDAEYYVEKLTNSPLTLKKNGFVFITMGAGDNWRLGEKLLEK